jgi:hypothetical protein
MKGGQMIRMAALAAIAGLGNALGGSVAGQGSIMNGYRAGAIVPTNEYHTISPNVSQWGYANGPGWTAAHVKRVATKRRNRARNKAAHRKARSLT